MQKQKDEGVYLTFFLLRPPNSSTFNQCSGERPACQRCAARGLICTYTGGRVRGPSKSRLRASASASEIRFAPDNLNMPSLDSLPKTPQRLRHVSAGVPSSSQTSSPIHRASPLTRPSPPFHLPAGQPKRLWSNSVSNPHDLRQVQNLALFRSTADQIKPSMLPEGVSYNVTSHGCPSRGGYDPNFLSQFFGIRNEGRVDQLNDYGSSSGYVVHSVAF